MIKYKIKDFFADTLGYLHYKATDTVPDNIAAQEAIVDDNVRIFKLYWSNTDKEQIPDLFKRIEWFMASKILKILIEDHSIYQIMDGEYTDMLCNLFEHFNDRRARKMINTLIDNRRYVTGSTTFMPRALVSASKCEEPSGLDFLYRLNQSWFEIYVKYVNAESLLQHIRDDNRVMVEAMLRYGFDVHTCDDTALSVATRGGDMKIIRTLCDYGADISGDSYHALAKAIARKNTELVVFYATIVWPNIADVPYGIAMKMLTYLLGSGRIEFSTEEIDETINIIKDYHDKPEMI